MRLIDSFNLSETLEELVAEYSNIYTNIVLITYKHFPYEDYVCELKLLHLALSTPLLTFDVIEQFLKKLEAKMPFPDVVVAIGGGVVLDTAKMLHYALHKEEHFTKLVLIPSTAGTGSEATSFAVVYDENKKKKTIDDPILIPNIVIHAPEILLSLPKKFRISSGFDALAQSMESMWSVHSIPESQDYAYQSLLLINKNFEDYVFTQNKEAAIQMQRAAFYSGKAINLSYTTLAHALSYHITSHFGVSHGHAVFLYIPMLINYNSKIPFDELVEKRGLIYVAEALNKICQAFEVDSIDDLILKMEKYFVLFDVHSKLGRFGVTKLDLDKIIMDASQSNRGQNNPRAINSSILKNLLSDHFPL